MKSSPLIFPLATKAGLAVMAALFVTLGVRSAGAGTPDAERVFAPTEPITHFERSGRLRLPEAASLTRTVEARTQFNVDGTGLAAAVLDTGIRPTHQDFPAGKILEQHNYTNDNGGDDNNALDGNGHGTNVAGIVAANGPTGAGQTGHTGIAPGAKLVPMKVLPNSGLGNGNWLASALQYLINNHSRLNITVANLSLGTNENLQGAPLNDSVRNQIAQLRAEKVAVVISAGNGFFTFGSVQGMSWPGIIPESVSVGAVYDAPFAGTYSYGSGASASPVVADQVCPFSQRLHASVNATTATDIFAPGAAITSTGSTSNTASSTMHGTSQAAPVTAGIILLLQQYHLRETGQLPSIDDIESWLMSGAVEVNDGDDETDNVTNTGLDFPRVDALGALQALEADLSGEYSISGRITSNGQGVPAVSVTAGNKTVPTNATGHYTIEGLEAGNYTVTPAKTNYQFTPASQQVNVQANVNNVDFTGIIPTYTVSGTIRVGISPLSDATVTGAGQTVSTNANGVFTLVNVLPGTYTVTPTKANYTFAPTSLQVTVSNAHVAAVDFAATLVTYSLSGTVTYLGQGVEGVTLTLTGGATTVTNAQGAYSFSGLLAGNYTITPSKSRTAFSPASQTVTVGPSADALNFTGTPQHHISGKILKDGSPLPGVLVSVPGRATTTNTAGEYSLINLEPGTYTVVPTLASHQFTPAQQQVVLGLADQAGVDFTGVLQTYTLGGRIALGGVGLEGVTVSRTGGATTTTAADGTYAFSGLAAGTYTLTPTLAGHTFNPTSRNATVGSPGNADAVDFTAALVQYSISGVVRFKGAPIPGVRVTAGGRSTITTANGAYTLPGLTLGTYSVVPSKLGCRFSPAATEASVGPDRTGVNFDGVAVPAVSGKITASKQGLAGVAVTLASAAGTRTTTTAADGTYSFNDVSSATYTLTPALERTRFTPATRRVRIVKASANGQNFTGAAIPHLVSLTLTSASVKGRRTTTATITVDGRAPAAMRVNLISSAPGAATVPAVVTLPKGRTSVRFTVRTKKVLTATPVTLTAILGEESRMAELTVTP